MEKGCRTRIDLFDISIWHKKCRCIDTFEKYRYGHFWKYRYIDIDKAIQKNIDIDKVIQKNINIDKAIPKNINIDIDKGILKISKRQFWKISISISIYCYILIRQFWIILISIESLWETRQSKLCETQKAIWWVGGSEYGDGWVVSTSVDSGSHKLSKNVWFVWSKSGDVTDLDGQTNGQTRKGRASQLLVCENLSRNI